MSTIAFICLGVCAVAGLLAAVWITAYRVGFDEGRLTIPLRMISAVAEHQIACLEGDPAVIAQELAEHLGLPASEARRLTARAEEARAPRATGLRSA